MSYADDTYLGTALNAAESFATYMVPPLKTTKDIIDEKRRELARVSRKLDMDMNKLEQTEITKEKKLTGAYLKRGEQGKARQHARELARHRSHHARLETAKSKVTIACGQLQHLTTTTQISDCMHTVTQALYAANVATPADKTAAIARQLDVQNDRMNLKREILDDAMDSLDETDEGDAEREIDDILGEIAKDLDLKAPTPPVAVPRMPVPKKAPAAKGPVGAAVTSSSSIPPQPPPPVKIAPPKQSPAIQLPKFPNPGVTTTFPIASDSSPPKPSIPNLFDVDDSHPHPGPAAETPSADGDIDEERVLQERLLQLSVKNF